jgi:hypothetical protein
MTTLPDSEVQVDIVETEKGGTGIAITASRGGKSRTWSGENTTVKEAVKGAIEKMLKDRRVGEFIK